MNILFLFTDEQRADTMAAYGNPHVQTPHLDRLASESVLFERCYVTQPVCTPSRATMMTGHWPHALPCDRNNMPLPTQAKTLAEMLPGHRAMHAGKWHLGDEIFAQHGFQDWFAFEDGYFNGYSKGRDPNARSVYDAWLRKKGYEPDIKQEKGPGRFSRKLSCEVPEEHGKPAFVADSFDAWIKGIGHDELFCAVANFLEPHMPFTGPRNGQYDPNALPLPSNFDAVPGEDAPLRPRMFHAFYRQEGFEGEDLGTEQGWRNIRARYHGLVSQVDAAVGRILHALEAAGRAEDTLVVYTSDHGDMMGSHGLLAKCVMYEEAVRVPLFFRVPGCKPARIAEAVSHIDLVPTLLDMAGAGVPADLPGESLRPALETGVHSARDVIVEWNGPDSGIPIADRGQGFPEALLARWSEAGMRHALDEPVRTLVAPEGWKLNFRPLSQCHELYHLAQDPEERTNRIADAPAGVVKDLAGRLREWGRANGDEVALM